MVTNEQIAEVWPACERAARRAARMARVPHLADDLVGEAAIKVVESAASYRPDGGASWKTWALRHARFGVLEGMRKGERKGARHLRKIGGRIPTTCSLDISVDETGNPICDKLVEDCDPIGWEIESADTVERLARATGIDAWVIVGTFLHGYPQRTMAEQRGVVPSWVSEVYTRAMRQLRANCPTGGAGC
jgi:RNA polymerase sigma factor (sigma-70 family)